MKRTISLSKKSLSGGGKLAIKTSASSAMPVNKVSKVKKTATSETFNNDYAIRIAQDISSYRYGKRMTGFVN